MGGQVQESDVLGIKRFAWMGKWAGATANEEKLLFDGNIWRLPLYC